MILESNKIWLFVDELMNWGILYNTIKDALKRNRSGKINSWRYRALESDKRTKLIDYDSLPDTTKSKLPSRIDLVKQCQANTTEAQLDIFEEACSSLEELHKKNQLITDYQFFLKRKSDKVKAEDLKQAAGWLRLLNAYKTPTQTRTINFATKALLRAAVVEKLISDMRKAKGKYLYGFKITNVAVLQRKELEWAKAIEQEIEKLKDEPLTKIELDAKANDAALATLLHENVGNQHRRILGALNENENERILLPSGKIDFSEWNARTLVYLYANPGSGNKFDFENIERRYKYACKKENRTPAVKLSAIKDFLTSNEVRQYTDRERHGYNFADKMLPHVYGKRGQYSLSKGGYDGFQVDFNSRVMVKVIDKKGEEKLVAKQMMLTVVAVWDEKSEAITGYDVGMVEDGLMVRNMWRNHLNRMGGRSYIEIESDRFSGNLAEETRHIFEATVQHITQPTPNDTQGKASNPKARFAERFVQEVNRLAQNYPHWKGTNITAIDKNRQPNPDYRKGNFVDGYSQAVKNIIEMINVFNHDKYNRSKSRWQECMDNINPNAPVIPQENISMLLNQSTVVAVRNGLVAFEVSRKPYEYKFEEYYLHTHAMMKGYKVKVYYDETDMSSVDVFGEDDQFIATLGRLKRVVKNKAEQTAEDQGRAAAMRANRLKAIQHGEGINRKLLELEASEYGLDISNMSLTEAQELIAGMKFINPEELFEEALSNPEAASAKRYYEDRILRANGELVPVSNQERKSLEQERREMVKENAKRKGLI